MHKLTQFVQKWHDLQRNTLKLIPEFWNKGRRFLWYLFIFFFLFLFKSSSGWRSLERTWLSAELSRSSCISATPICEIYTILELGKTARQLPWVGMSYARLLLSIHPHSLSAPVENHFSYVVDRMFLHSSRVDSIFFAETSVEMLFTRSVVFVFLLW